MSVSDSRKYGGGPSGYTVRYNRIIRNNIVKELAMRNSIAYIQIFRNRVRFFFRSLEVQF